MAETEFWLYEEQQVVHGIVATAEVHPEAWRPPDRVEALRGHRYEIEFIRQKLAQALAGYRSGRWRVRFDKGGVATVRPA